MVQPPAPLSPSRQLMQPTATMEGRWITLQISSSNSRPKTDLFKSLREVLQLWLRQIKTRNNRNRNRNLLQSQNPNSSNEQEEQNKDKDRNQFHRQETRTTTAQ